MAKKDADSQNIASRIRTMREKRGLKQVELAARAGLQPSAISQFENEQRDPSNENLCRLADALGVTVDFLLGRNPPQPSGPQLQAVFRHAKDFDQEALNELQRFAEFLAQKDQQTKRDSDK